MMKTIMPEQMGLINHDATMEEIPEFALTADQCSAPGINDLMLELHVLNTGVGASTCMSKEGHPQMNNEVKLSRYETAPPCRATRGPLELQSGQAESRPTYPNRWYSS